MKLTVSYSDEFWKVSDASKFTKFLDLIISAPVMEIELGKFYGAFKVMVNDAQDQLFKGQQLIVVSAPPL